MPEQSIAAGKSLREIESELEAADAQVIGLVRNEVRIAAPSPFREVRAGDILIIEAEPESLATALSSLGLKLEEDRPQANDDAGADAGADDDDKATDDGADLESGASEPEPGASTLAADAGKDGGVGADPSEARSGGAVAALSDERAKADGTEGAAKSAGSDTSSKVATSAKVERSSVLQNKEVELMELTVPIRCFDLNARSFETALTMSWQSSNTPSMAMLWMFSSNRLNICAC